MEKHCFSIATKTVSTRSNEVFDFHILSRMVSTGKKI